MKKVTNHADYYVVEKKTKPEDLINRQMQKALRNKRRGAPPKYRHVVDRSRAKEFAKRRAVRRVRVIEGLCSNCGDEGLTNGFKMCAPCRLKWRQYNTRCRRRKDFPVTPHSLGKIDLQGASFDF
jgi:hypothetical protein